MTDNCYKLKNGTIVNINDLSNLTAKDRDELFNTPLNLYEGLHIKNNLSELNASLSIVLSFIQNHDTNCPVANPKITEMIDSRMKLNIKESILTSGNIAKAITAIFVFFAGFGTLFFILIKQFS